MDLVCQMVLLVFPGDERLQKGTAESITFEPPVAYETELVFLGNKWKGIVNLQIDGAESMLDTYLNSDDGIEVRTTLVLPSAM